MRTGLLSEEPGYERLGILPFKVRRSVMVEGPKRKLALPQAVVDLVRTVDTSGRAMRGELDPDSQEGREAAFELALGLLGAGTVWNAGRRGAKGAVGMITTHDRAPWAAPIAAGGGPPGKQLVVMSTKDFQMRPDAMSELLRHGQWEGPLSGAFRGRVLDVHPEVAQYRTILGRDPSPPQGIRGSFDPNTNTIRARAPVIEAELIGNPRPLGVAPRTVEGVTVHELAHAIQNLTGQDAGTNAAAVMAHLKSNLAQQIKQGVAPDPKAARQQLRTLQQVSSFEELGKRDPKLADLVFLLYQRTYGEEGARLAQKLMGLSDNELWRRRKTLPSFFDVPVHKQVASP